MCYTYHLVFNVHCELIFPSLYTQVHNTVFSINPLSDAGTRSLLAPASIEGLVAAVISKTMNSKQHGPSVTVNRLADRYACNTPIKINYMYTYHEMAIMLKLWPGN